jgi:hypothetical protein
MGGFAPPNPTAPTVNSGVRTVTHIDTATSLIKDVSSEVQFEHADASPLLAFTKAIRGRKPATQRRFDWPFVKDYPRSLTVEQAATAAATSATITEYGRIIAGMQYLNLRTGEVGLFTATPSSTTVSIGARANAQAMVAGDQLRIISNAQEEVRSLPAIRSQAEEYFYNYTQIFDTVWGYSDRAGNSDSYVGKEPAVERKKAMVRHNQDIEEAFINGWRYQSSTGGPVNSSEITFTGGLRYWVQSNYWNLAGNEPTESQFMEYLAYIFEFGDGGYSKGGTAKKLALGGPAWAALFEKWLKQKLEYSPADDKVGVKVANLTMTVGELMFKLHPLFAKAGYRDKLLIIDMNHLVYRHHQGLDTMIAENVQTPGDSVKKHHIVTDCGLEVNGDERAHGWVEGLGVAVA